MALNRRRITLLFCLVLGLMLLLFAGHSAEHLHHHHTHPHDCAVCGVMEGWFSLLKRAAASAPALMMFLPLLLISRGLLPVMAAPRQDITPVTLKVKISS